MYNVGAKINTRDKKGSVGLRLRSVVTSENKCFLWHDKKTSFFCHAFTENIIDKISKLC